jgi:hypothetical protein
MAAAQATRVYWGGETADGRACPLHPCLTAQAGWALAGVKTKTTASKKKKNLLNIYTTQNQ